jgi:hypothetical protein
MAALHDMPAGTQEQVACYCCGRQIKAGKSRPAKARRHHGEGKPTSHSITRGCRSRTARALP